MLTSDSFVTHGSVSQTLRVLNERERGREWASDLARAGEKASDARKRGDRPQIGG